MTVVASENTPSPTSFDILNIVHKKNGKAFSSYPYSCVVFPEAYRLKEILHKQYSMIRNQ